jgi:DNA-binding PadR family transcriptional regulator
MPRSAFLGEWEQLVLLAILRQRHGAYVIGLRADLARVMHRQPSRGALYQTLDRLEDKGFVRAIEDAPSPDRGGHPRRRFVVTRAGIAALKASRKALLELWNSVEEVLE